jgi:hypothetical protein
VAVSSSSSTRASASRTCTDGLLGGRAGTAHGGGMSTTSLVAGPVKAPGVLEAFGSPSAS